MDHNDIDLVPTPDEYAKMPLCRYLFETHMEHKTTLSWLQSLDDDTLMMIVDSAEKVNQLNLPDLEDLPENNEDSTDDPYQELEDTIDEGDPEPNNPFKDYEQDFVAEPNDDTPTDTDEALDDKDEMENSPEEATHDYAILAGSLCTMEYDRQGKDAETHDIPEDVLVDAIQFLCLWVVFEQLRRKELVVITGEGLLTKHYTTFFTLTKKGELVSQYMKCKSDKDTKPHKRPKKPVDLPVPKPDVDISTEKACSLLKTLHDITYANCSGVTTIQEITTTTTTKPPKKRRKKNN